MKWVQQTLLTLLSLSKAHWTYVYIQFAILCNCYAIQHDWTFIDFFTFYDLLSLQFSVSHHFLLFSIILMYEAATHLDFQVDIIDSFSVLTTTLNTFDILMLYIKWMYFMVLISYLFFFTVCMVYRFTQCLMLVGKSLYDT